MSLEPQIVGDKLVLMRVDFNVDIDSQGNIIDDFRLERVMSTIKFLRDNRASKIILISHLARPEPQDRNNPAFSLKPIGDYLEKLLDKKVYFYDDEINKALRDKIESLPQGSIVLLENMRFYSGETENDYEFAKSLSQLGDLYINEAFSVSHRKVASLCAITKFLPSYFGILFEEERKHLDTLMDHPQPPLVVVLGGAKIEDKLPLISKFLNSADYLLIGGAMANTIIKAWQFEIGKSFYEEKMLNQAQNLGSAKAELIIPGDFVVLTSRHQKEVRNLGSIEPGDNILDIGPVAGDTFSKLISKAQTILWNGPMGKIEDPQFRTGTDIVIKAIMANHHAQTVIGGGETLMSIKNRDTIPVNVFLSTGGGAMLDYLAGKTLPGIEAIENK
jgi:phosphoglycerate kinase